MGRGHQSVTEAICKAHHGNLELATNAPPLVRREKESITISSSSFLVLQSRVAEKSSFHYYGVACGFAVIVAI